MGNIAIAQMVGTNIFLQGNYVEAGVQNNGAFGATGVPSGYHPHTTLGSGTTGTSLSMVYDLGHDGWTTGTPAFMGDYTYPGVPFEGWEMQLGSARVQAFQGGMGATGSGGGGALSGIVTSYSMSIDGARAYWRGITSGGSSSIQVKKDMLVRTNGSSVLVKVTLNNLGGVPSPNIYYLRTCDPDVDQTWAGGAFTTANTVMYQNDTAHRVLVEASGNIAGASLSLGAKDARARAFTYTSWPIGVGVDLATVHAGTAYGVNDTLGVTMTGDNAIGLVFNLGSIPTGDSVSFSYAYIFNGASGIDSAFMSFPPPTIVADTRFIDQNISLFPNPTTGELTIKTDGQTFASFTITNAVGQQVWQQAIGKAQERMELGHLPAGVYYVTLRGEQGSEVRKFVMW